MKNILLGALLSGFIPHAMGKGGSGKGGGGGGSGGASKGSTCANCRSGMQFMYGQRNTSLFTDIELFVQLGLYGVWSLVLLAFYIRLRKLSAVTIRLAIAAFVLAFILLIIRYGLIFAQINVPTGYRHESSIVVLLYWLGITFLFLAISREIEFNKVQGIINVALNAIFAALSLTYIVYDFLVSEQATDHYMLTTEWWLSDRDFGLSMDSANIRKLTGSFNGLSPAYIRNRMFEKEATKFLTDRNTAIKVGISADLFGLLIAGYLTGIVAWKILRRKQPSLGCPTHLLVAISGILISLTYRFFVSAYFTLHNWAVVTNDGEWVAWIQTYPSIDPTSKIIAPETFLMGYRVAVPGFPFVHAILLPLGLVISSAGTALLMARKRYQPVVTTEQMDEGTKV